jgi:beta-glucosidase-like glycosyl hydrolase
MKHYRWSFVSLSLLLIAPLLALPQTETNGQTAGPPYKNPALPIEKRVEDLVSRMTLEEKVSQMMNGAAAIERLDIPAYDWWNEALHGVARAGYATVFPQAIGLAATWDEGPHPPRRRRPRPRRAPSTMNSPAQATAAAIRVSLSGAPTLIYFATRAGVAGRRHMAKTRI